MGGARRAPQWGRPESAQLRRALRAGTDRTRRPISPRFPNGPQPLDAGLATSGVTGDDVSPSAAGALIGRVDELTMMRAALARGPLGSADRRPGDGRSWRRQVAPRRRSRDRGPGGWDARPPRRGRRVAARPDGTVAGRLPRARCRARQRSVAAGRGATVGTSRVVVRHVALREPTLVVLEDLHWADPIAIWVLDHLPRALGDGPIALVATSRDHEPGMPRLDGVRRVARVVQLRGLDVDEVRQLAAAETTESVDAVALHTADRRQSAVRAGARSLPRRGRGDRRGSRAVTRSVQR